MSWNFSDHESEVSSASDEDFTTYSMSREIKIGFEAGDTYHKSYSTISMPMGTIIPSESDCDTGSNREVVTQLAEDAVDGRICRSKTCLHGPWRGAESREPHRDSRDVGDNLFRRRPSASYTSATEWGWWRQGR